MQIVVIDGMGGGLGVQLVTLLVEKLGAQAEIVALGTNSLATNRMVKAGAQRGATGENAVRVSIKKADVVVGPVGIVIPNALMGEITPQIAESVASCEARKYLIPVSQSHFEIVGLENRSLALLLKEAVDKIALLLKG
ncbi:Hypothetical protein LUCI_1737 [Lucifera butyrica]|uniref:DUF3842 family protein n=1 Tax=Lucifera butyrica TaxID=1351585 RepID=A0A498R4Y1_9FIRM|nr:DUF3842 family protein [Lucifera butyrica]VBB06504.1 Hypothetical protein LUCI_1737 [Lucifera butyrica]